MQGKPVSKPRRKVVKDQVVVVNPQTGEYREIEREEFESMLPNRHNAEDAIASESRSASRWINRAKDRMAEGMSDQLKWILVSTLFLAAGATLGIFGQPIMERQIAATALQKAMATSIPVVNATNVAIDPGKFAGKLTDVIMTPTRGGVFKSGKGLYIAESEDGMSLVIFESAFAAFEEAWQVTRPDQIAAHLIGKVIKARGTVQARPQKDGSSRTSMIVYAPGLLQVIPERP